MLISVNWLSDYVAIPPDVGPKELAERFTLVCAEVEGVEAIEVGARGLICAEVKSVESVESVSDKADGRGAEGGGPRKVMLAVGSGAPVQTVTNAPNLEVGDRVVFAPTGASVRSLGTIADSTVAGLKSSGMILPGDALGIALAAREAVFLPSDVAPGTALDEAFADDWVIDIDNHSINHRPDLWGHYGIAREVAAMLGTPLRPLAVADRAELDDPSLPEIPIEIDDPDACPRYSGLLMESVASRPSPLWMQLRLGHVGLRPIDFLVDLTNYIMLELGQPMHAFDADRVSRIEVGFVPDGTKFTTLDLIERTLPDGALMILCERRPIALAGIMGGADSEIRPTTQSMLLESANFNPYVIRRCATRLGHRTDASARFEKSLDPKNTVLAIQRFVHLGRREFDDLKLASRLSDAYPKPSDPVVLELDPEHVCRYLGRGVDTAEMIRILRSLEFDVSENGNILSVTVPSFRATRDVQSAVDLIEEIARFVGYGHIEAVYPKVEIRALDANRTQMLERQTLQIWTQAAGCCEVFDYLWYDSAWCASIGFDPGDCLTLRNPAAEGLERMRQSLMPGLLASAARNRHHFATFKLLELGSAFPPDGGRFVERRRIGLLYGGKGKKLEDDRLAELKADLRAWAGQVLAQPVRYAPVDLDEAFPWCRGPKTIGVEIGGRPIGRLGAVPLDLRRRMDEHLASWHFVWAEIDLDGLDRFIGRHLPLGVAAPHPEVAMDFSFLVPVSQRYATLSDRLTRFDHPLLRRLSFADAYEGKSVPEGKRSITVRASIGAPDRTLTDDDIQAFRTSFEEMLKSIGATLRS